MIHVGIDPGTKGAVAALDDAGVVIGVWDTPTAALGAATKTGRKKIVDAAALARLLNGIPGTGRLAWSPMIVTVEAVHSMPGEGVSSAFTFGGAYMAARAVVEVLAHLYPELIASHPEPACATGRCAVTLVQPPTWRKSAGLPVGCDKPTYWREAVKRWPAAALAGPRGGMQVDRAAALLIADHGRRLHLGATMREAA